VRKVSSSEEGFVNGFGLGDVIISIIVDLDPVLLPREISGRDGDPALSPFGKGGLMGDFLMINKWLSAYSVILLTGRLLKCRA